MAKAKSTKKAKVEKTGSIFSGIVNVVNPYKAPVFVPNEISTFEPATTAKTSNKNVARDLLRDTNQTSIIRIAIIDLGIKTKADYNDTMRNKIAYALVNSKKQANFKNAIQRINTYKGRNGYSHIAQDNDDSTLTAIMAKVANGELTLPKLDYSAK